MVSNSSCSLMIATEPGYGPILVVTGSIDECCSYDITSLPSQSYQSDKKFTCTMTQMTTPSIPPLMRAAQISEYGKPYELVERHVPEVRDNELLIRVHAAGFCHSDLQVLQGQFKSPLGMTPSHEPAGVIVKVGAKCSPAWKIGDRVGALNYKNSCGECSGCGLTKRTSGLLDPRFCDKRETAGFQHDGAFAEYLSIDPETTVRLPASLSFDQAAPLMCAGATVWGSLERATAGLSPSETVAVVGIGGLGHLGLQFATAMGFRTIAIDNRPAGRQLATEMPNEALKPALVVDSGAEDATAKIMDFTNGEGVAAVVVCTDSLAANNWALSILRIGGVMGVLGLPADAWRFDSSVIVFKELTIRGSYVASRTATERMMRIVEEAGVRSHITLVPFDGIPGVVEIYQDSAFRGRLVVQVTE
ncbi:alcohol dehydrogenase GroES-like domain-containing protein [Colletotrichum asianum]